MYKVRTLTSDCKHERFESFDSYSDAVDCFLFYVHLALELDLHVRCVNIIRGKKSIKTFQNH